MSRGQLILIVLIFLLVAGCRGTKSQKIVSEKQIFLIEHLTNSSLDMEKVLFLLTDHKVGTHDEIILINEKTYFKNLIILSDFDQIHGCCQDDFNLNDLQNLRNLNNQFDKDIYLENVLENQDGYDIKDYSVNVYKLKKFKYCICSINYTRFTSDAKDEKKLFIYPYQMEFSTLNKTDKLMFKGYIKTLIKNL